MTNILIVEDESIVAWDIKETLEKLGHQVVDLVGSGADAIRSAITSQPDLVLMDIRLTGAMDGITAAQEIYDRLNIPIVYLTAHADARTLERATQTNPFGYITKPFQAQTLHSTIQVALQRHQTEKSARLTQIDLATTLNSIGSGIITTDRQGLVTFINPIAQKLTGWTSTAAIGIQIDRVFRLIWETDSSAIENPSVRAMRLQQTVKSPDRCWLVGKDGLEIPISDTANPIYQPDGEIVGSVVVFQDNTEPLSERRDLWERNQDLEFSHYQLIVELQEQIVAYQQSLACLQILDLVFNQVHTAKSEVEMIQLVIQQLGMFIDADYCWCTLHDRQADTARIVGEYLDRERQINPTSKIGKEIDIQLYPEFYNHLFDRQSWIDPPLEIIPKPYLNLLPLAAQTIVCPIIADFPDAADRSDRIDNRTIGEVGILTLGKRQWKSFQAHLFTQILRHAIKLFRQTHRNSIVEAASPQGDRDESDRFLEWLNSVQTNFSRSIASINRDINISARKLQQLIGLNSTATENSAVVAHYQSLHRELSVKLLILQVEWQQNFQLISTLIEVGFNGKKFQIQSLSNIQFERWLADLVEKCPDLAIPYRQEIGYRINTELLPPILLCPFPLVELSLVELFYTACQYTPPDRAMVLEVDVRADKLQLAVVSEGIELSARELATLFSPVAANSQELDSQQRLPSLGIALVKQLVLHLDGNVRASSDRNGTSLILTVPLS